MGNRERGIENGGWEGGIGNMDLEWEMEDQHV